LVVAQKFAVRWLGRSRERAIGDATSGPVRTHSDVGRLGGLFAVLAMIFLVDGAHAIGLGTAVLDSGLGEPLRFSVPVSLQPGEEAGCVQVRARGDDLPTVFNTRSSVVRVGDRTQIEIRSAQAVNEPMVGLVVSVGCASAVSREFVFFLDPPVEPVPATVAPRALVEPANVPQAVRPPRSTPSARRPAGDGTAAGTSAALPTPKKARTRPARTPAVTTAPAGAAPPTKSGRTGRSPAARSATPGTGGDRLSVVPTQPQTTDASTPPSNAAPGAPASPGPSVSAAAASPTSTATANGPTTDSPAAAAQAPASAPTSDETAAREQVLKQQRDALQARIKTLDDQVTALREQTAALVARNQTLEEQTPSSILMWVLLAVAVVALLVAAWLAWRYAQLRRSFEDGGPWWSGHTGFATMGAAEAPPTAMAPQAVAAAPTPPLRAPTRTDVRTTNTAPVDVEPSPPAARAPVRAKAYPPAIETDFTVSDIEAAMATVRTVSTPRRNEPPTSLTETDLRPLGGPTMPSPFIDPPAAPTPRRAGSPPPPTPSSATDPLVSTSGTGNAEARFVDFDVPPLQAAPKKGEDVAATYDFALDIPSDFDPLETDSHKQTHVERTNSPDLDFELPVTPPGLDLELPARTEMTSTTVDDRDTRHGATALDQLFATDTGRLGPDTILDLDDRSGVRLSRTEMEALSDEDGPASVQQRMTRFADVMNQVDEFAGTDPLRSIALLRQYVLRDEDIPTVLWLRLFELYKAVDKKPVYEALAEHFARRYHRPMAGWGQTLADRVPQTPLSALRELDAEIEAMWGTKDGLERLHGLLCGREQPDTVVFNAVLQRDLLDAAKVFLLDRDSSIAKKS
jgi:hypothetical protein